MAGLYLPISSVIWPMKGSKASRAACSEGNLALIKSTASKSWGRREGGKEGSVRISEEVQHDDTSQDPAQHIKHTFSLPTALLSPPHSLPRCHGPPPHPRTGRSRGSLVGMASCTACVTSWEMCWVYMPSKTDEVAALMPVLLLQVASI